MNNPLLNPHTILDRSVPLEKYHLPPMSYRYDAWLDEQKDIRASLRENGYTFYEKETSPTHFIALEMNGSAGLIKHRFGYNTTRGHMSSFLTATGPHPHAWKRSTFLYEVERLAVACYRESGKLPTSPVPVQFTEEWRALAEELIRGYP